MAKVLSGVRVVEHGTFITGPAASMLLADLGADVIKVEQPAGDPFRAFRGGLYSAHYQTYNRNKNSVTLPGERDRAAHAVRRPALCHARGAYHTPARADRTAEHDLPRS